MSSNVVQVKDVHFKCTTVLEDGKEETFEFVKSKVESFSMTSNRYRGGIVITTFTLKEKAAVDATQEMDARMPEYKEEK